MLAERYRQQVTARVKRRTRHSKEEVKAMRGKCIVREMEAKTKKKRREIEKGRENERYSGNYMKKNKETLKIAESSSAREMDIRLRKASVEKRKKKSPRE